MPARGTLFVNARAGVVLNPDLGLEVAAEASARGLEVVRIDDALDVSLAVRQRLARGVRLFVAAGGDGTVHHVLQALVNTDAVLAVVPLGTYNHFARDLGLPLDWRAALEVALEGDVRQVDTGRVNDRFFVNNVSFGLYPEIVARREEHGRDYPRWRARMLAFYATARRFRHVTLSVESEQDRQVVRTHMFLVSNNSYDLERIGIEASRPRLTEGELSVYWLPQTSRWRLMRFAGRYLAGRVRQTPGFRSFRTRHVRVHSSHRMLQAGIDGEVFALQPPLVVMTAPASLQVRVPAAGDPSR